MGSNPAAPTIYRPVGHELVSDRCTTMPRATSSEAGQTMETKMTAFIPVILLLVAFAALNYVNSGRLD